MIEYLLIIVACLIISSLMIYLAYNSYAKTYSKYLSVPITIIISTAIYFQFVSLSGVPINKLPEGEWVYVHHKITFDGRYIYLWVQHDKNFERLYKIDYDRSIAQKLYESASQGIENNVMIVGEFSDELADGSKTLNLEQHQILVNNPSEFK